MPNAGSFFARPHEAFVAGFYRNDDFDFEVRTVLGHAAFGASDVGEVLSAIAPVGENDYEAWFAAWHSLGERVQAIADAAADAGHPLSASAAYLRASRYFAVAVNSVAGLATDDQLLPTFRRHRAAWDRFIDTTPLTTERVKIPYEGGTLPGYLVKPAKDKRARRTIILSNGSDGSLSSLWASGGAGAIARGYNVLMFDGPGQQSELFERGVPFRPDWEAVITPVVDYLLTRADVDADRIAIYGISQGGYWVPRALAFEHRIAAAIADPGIVDVSTSWTSHLPKGLMALVAAGQTDPAQAEKFDRDMALGMRLSKDTARTWNFRARPFKTDGYFATISEVMRYTLESVASSISTPVLITNPDDEQFWPGQSARLADLIPGYATLLPFTAQEGANLHCEPLARTLVDQRMFDWLDDILAAPKAVPADPAAVVTA